MNISMHKHMSTSIDKKIELIAKFVCQLKKKRINYNYNQAMYQTSKK